MSQRSRRGRAFVRSVLSISLAGLLLVGPSTGVAELLSVATRHVGPRVSQGLVQTLSSLSAAVPGEGWTEGQACKWWDRHRPASASAEPPESAHSLLTKTMDHVWPRQLELKPSDSPAGPSR